MQLALVPKLFKFRDWAELPPEPRARRILQKSRIPEITQYLLDEEDGFRFSSLTASFNCAPTFPPVAGHADRDVLQMPFEADLGCVHGAVRGALRKPFANLPYSGAIQD